MKNLIRKQWNLIFIFITVTILAILMYPKEAKAVEEYQGLQIENGVVISYRGDETEIVLPDTINGVKIVGIGDRAFADNMVLKSIVLSDTVGYIGDSAFEGCGSLEKVVMGDGVTKLGVRAFYNCSKLNNMVLSQKLKVIDTWTFGYCKQLEEILFPNELETIGSASFYGCSSLRTIIIPDSVTEIGTHSFRDCRKLSKIQYSNQMQSIPYRAFSGCVSLEEVNFPDSIETVAKEAFYQCSALKAIEMSEGIVSIGEGAFYECNSIRALTLPNTVTNIDSNAFFKCCNIEELRLSNNLLHIGSRAFYGCEKIVSIIIPASVTNIEEAAFERCNRLVEIYNLSSLELQTGSTDNGFLSQYALCIHASLDEASHLQKSEDCIFYIKDDECLLVAYIGINSSVALPATHADMGYNIHNYAFYNNQMVTSIIVPSGVACIGKGVFEGCTKLYRITLPKSIKTIGDGAFYSCQGLQYVAYEGNEKEWQEVSIGHQNEELSEWDMFYKGTSTQENKTQQVNYSESVDFSELIENNIFFINFLATLFWGFVLVYSKTFNNTPQNIRKNKRRFVIIASVQWILISGLRADTVGADTENYMRLFDTHNNMEWGDIFKGIKIYYKTGGTIVDEYEPGYILLEKLIGTFTTSHIAYKFIIASIFMAAFGRFVYKNSDDPCLSFIVYSAIFHNMFSLTGYRQVVSAALGILLGYEFVKKRKLGAFLILVLIASLFHKSTLIFIPFYFLANKKMTKKYILVASAIIMTMLVFRYQLFNYVKMIVGYDEYDGLYGFAQLTFTILLFGITIVSFYFKGQVLRFKAEAIHYYNGLLLMWMMMPFAMVSPTSMRLVYDFGFMLLLLVPALVKSFRKSRNRLILYSVIVLIFAYFIITKSPAYQFYWS